MTHPDAEKWNKRYGEEGSRWLSSKPRQLLHDFACLLPDSGMALDAAAGVALHGRFLAERGFHVIALDISEVGLHLAKQDAAKRGLWLETAVIDLTTLWLPANCFDVIVNFRYLERSTFSVYRQALRPGGLLIFETFVQPNTPEEHPHYFLKPGELRAAFATLEIIHSEITAVHGAISHRLKMVEQLVARKPYDISI